MFNHCVEYLQRNSYLYSITHCGINIIVPRSVQSELNQGAFKQIVIDINTNSTQIIVTLG